MGFPLQQKKLNFPAKLSQEFQYQKPSKNTYRQQIQNDKAKRKTRTDTTTFEQM